MCESIFTPLKNKSIGINDYKFYFGGFLFIIKSDKRNFNSYYKEIEISRGKPIVIPEILLEDDEYIKKMISSNINNKSKM